ncbi:POK25 protein, partial [Corythaixoides concolor]|nr:POK25 protein [Corythaixoides concolor]
SPTICQLVVDDALRQVRQVHKNIILYHYMDDILLAAETKEALQQVFETTELIFHKYGLWIAEKVQLEAPWKYLGWKLYESQIFPQNIPLVANDSLAHPAVINKCLLICITLVLISFLFWIFGNSITTKELSPLFNLLKGDPDLTSVRKLTEPAKQALQLVTDKISTTFAYRINIKLPIRLFL